MSDTRKYAVKRHSAHHWAVWLMNDDGTGRAMVYTWETEAEAIRHLERLVRGEDPESVGGNDCYYSPSDDEVVRKYLEGWATYDRAIQNGYYNRITY